MELDGIVEPPAMRAVCRESRWVSDQFGSLVDKLCGSSSRGWFNATIDEVFIHVDTICRFQDLNLSSVKILGFPQCQFYTPEKCTRILNDILQFAPRCRVVKLYLCRSAIIYGDYDLWNGKAGFSELEDEEIIGVYRTLQDLGWTQISVSWADLRHGVTKVWEEYMESADVKAALPCLVGVRACYC